MIIECFHRQMKAALKAQQDPDHWCEALPLGICTALKDDLGCTAAELVYHTSLHLPGKFFTPSGDDGMDLTAYVSKLRATMQTLQPTPTRHTPCSQVYTKINRYGVERVPLRVWLRVC